MIITTIEHSLPKDSNLEMPYVPTYRMRASARSKGRARLVRRRAGFPSTNPLRARSTRVRGPMDVVLFRTPAPTRIHTFRRKIIEVFSLVTGVDGLVASSHQLAVDLTRVPGFSSLVTVFDLFRFHSTVAEISLVNAGVNVDPGTMYVMNDVNDTAAVTTVALLEADQSITKHLGNGNYFSFSHPIPMSTKVPVNGVDTGSGPAQMLKMSPWLATAINPDTIHGCAKVGLAGNASSTYQFRVVYDVCLQLRFGQ